MRQEDLHALRLAPFQEDLLIAFELLHRTRHAGREVAHVELRHLGAVAAARVPHVERHPTGAVVLPRDFQPRIGESGIGKAVTEGIERFGRRAVVPAVTHEDAFVVVDARLRCPLAVRTVDVLVIAAVAGIVLGAPFDRDRQFAAGRNRSRQNLGDRAAALLPGIPGHEDRTRPVGELREIDPAAAVDHYHEVRVELRHGGDLGGLSFGQGEGAVVVFPFGIAVEAGAVDHRVGRRDPPLAIRHILEEIAQRHGGRRGIVVVLQPHGVTLARHER